MGILPRNDGPVGPTINRINANLEKLADGKTVRYLNINDRLADANGKLIAGMTVDRPFKLILYSSRDHWRDAQRTRQ